MCLVIQLYSTLCDPMDCSPQGSFIHGILQGRILEWVAMPFSRASSRPRDRACIEGRVFAVWAAREAIWSRGSRTCQWILFKDLKGWEKEKNPRRLVKIRGRADVRSMVSFSVMGEFGGSLCVFRHVEKQSSFSDMLSMRCLLQMYPTTVLPPIWVLHLMTRPVPWQFAVFPWRGKTVSEGYRDDLHLGLSLSWCDLGSPLNRPEGTHAILIKVTPRGTQACDPHWSH